MLEQDLDKCMAQMSFDLKDKASKLFNFEPKWFNQQLSKLVKPCVTIAKKLEEQHEALRCAIREQLLIEEKQQSVRGIVALEKVKAPGKKNKRRKKKQAVVDDEDLLLD